MRPQSVSAALFSSYHSIFPHPELRPQPVGAPHPVEWAPYPNFYSWSMGVSCYVAFALAALSSLPFTVGRASAKRPQCDKHPGLRTWSPSWLERRGLFSHQAEIRLLRHDEQVPMRLSCEEEDWMPGLSFGFRNRGAPRLHLCLRECPFVIFLFFGMYWSFHLEHTVYTWKERIFCNIWFQSSTYV